MLKKMNFLFVVLTVLIGASYSLNVSATSDKVVAIVNEHVITQSELDARMTSLRHYLAHNNETASGSSSNKINIRQRALDELIDRELQLQMAQRGNVQVSEVAIDNAIATITKRNKISLEQLKKELQKQGTSYMAFRKQIREDMMIGNVVQHVLGPKVKINEQEIDDFLRHAPVFNRAPNNQEYHCIDILIPTAEPIADSNLDAAKQIAATILTKLRHGAEIAETIKGLGSVGETVQMNDLGWRTVQNLPTIFVPAITKLKPLDTAGPLVAPNGVHLIKLAAVRGETPPSPKITKDEAREMVYQIKMAKLLKPWLQQLRATNYIKTVTDN